MQGVAGHASVSGGWRDPLLILAVLGPLLLLLLMGGAHLGEPVADDYDYLYHILLSGSWSWFDGCGSSFYWRPLSRQAYYATLAPWMLNRPLAIALLQLICLCIVAGLLYRAFRPALGGPTALAISTAPWMMESSRLLIAWPSCFQDLGALLFVALALHEAVAGRMWSFLVAGLAALLCKEVAVVPLLATLTCPAVRLVESGKRRIWIVSVSVLVAAWAVVYLIVHVGASLAFPGSGGTAWSSRPWSQAIALVPWWSFKAIWSRPPTNGPVDLFLVLGLVALIPWSRAAALLGRERSELRAWWTWGLLWSMPLVLTLVPFYPGWWPYRLAFIALGPLAATMITLTALNRYALPTFIVLRLALLAVAPTPVHDVAVDRPLRDASIDVPQLSRLQRFAADTRGVLRSRFPTLPGGSAVVWENFPAMTEHAFGSRPALHVWYRDTTLKWLSIGQWMAKPSERVATIVEYQPDRHPNVALVEPEAMRALLRANDALTAGREAESLRWLVRAESLQVDTTAHVFLDSIAGKRAYALGRMRFNQGRYDEARSHLLVVLSIYPGDVPSRRLLREIETLSPRTGRSP